MANKIGTRARTEIDAAGRSVGRVATEVATLLMGKHRPDYTPHIDRGDIVLVRNARLVKITGSKLETKEYFSYSGYPSGLKRKKLKDVMAKDPSDAIRRAVKNMLPKNRLQNERMKRLTVRND